MSRCCELQQAKQPQHAKKPSIVSELGAELERQSTDDLAREVYNYTGETGTYRYMAPEVFRHEPYNAKVCRTYGLTSSIATLTFTRGFCDPVGGHLDAVTAAVGW